MQTRWKQFLRSCSVLILSSFAVAYAQTDEEQAAHKVITQWLQNGGPCLNLEAEAMFGKRGVPLTGNELIFSDTPPLVTARGNVIFWDGDRYVIADEMTLGHSGAVVVASGNIQVADEHGAGRRNKGASYTGKSYHTSEPEALVEDQSEDTRSKLQRLEISTQNERDRFELIVRCKMYMFAVVRGAPWEITR